MIPARLAFRRHDPSCTAALGMKGLWSWSASRNWSMVSGSRTSRDGDPRRSLSSSRDSTYTRVVAENEILVLAY